MFNLKSGTVYVSVVLLVMFGAMLGGMDETGLTILFFVLWGCVALHRRHVEKAEFENKRSEYKASLNDVDNTGSDKQ